MSTSGLGTCAVTLGGEIYCFGQNYAGNLGNVPQRFQPFAQVGTDSDWSAVATTFFFTCALKTDGSLWCWGRNDHGEIAGTQLGSTVPDPLR